MSTVLEVEGLRTAFPIGGRATPVVDDVSFTLCEGQTLALVGESGCGKSVCALSLLRLVPRPGRIEAGRVRLAGRDLRGLAVTEMRRVRKECMATIGEVGNSDHELTVVGKAGANRWRGRRPKVRGVAMNPVDHPLGGGEGRASGGRPPVSPWGKPEGKKTRKKKKDSNKYIVRGRKRGKATKS